MSNTANARRMTEILTRSFEEIRSEFPDAEIKEIARADANREARDKARPRLYAEGDSWFDFPWWIIFNRCSDILDALLFKHKYEVRRESRRGDTAKNMLRPENILRLQSRMRQDKPHAFLISAGGNDMFTEGGHETVFASILRDKNPDDPIDLARMDREMNTIASDIQTLATIANNEGVPAFIHGYARPPMRVLGYAAVPIFAGPWINPVLQRKGYSKHQGVEILGVILDAFNDRLSNIANNAPMIEYVDLADVITSKNHWHDELHLDASGWQLAGDTFHKALRRVL